MLRVLRIHERYLKDKTRNQRLCISKLRIPACKRWVAMPRSFLVFSAISWALRHPPAFNFCPLKAGNRFWEGRRVLAGPAAGADTHQALTVALFLRKASASSTNSRRLQKESTTRWQEKGKGGSAGSSTLLPHCQAPTAPKGWHGQPHFLGQRFAAKLHQPGRGIVHLALPSSWKMD